MWMAHLGDDQCRVLLVSWGMALSGHLEAFGYGNQFPGSGDKGKEHSKLMITLRKTWLKPDTGNNVV